MKVIKETHVSEIVRKRAKDVDMPTSLLSISDLSIASIGYLMELSSFFDSNGARMPLSLWNSARVVANLFYENSTRTRLSFEMAAHRLGGSATYIDSTTSSAKKGESIKDTAVTLTQLGYSILVVRHPNEGVPTQLSRWVPIPVINAGDGCHEHPTQALSDLYVLQRRLGGLEKLIGLKVGIVGDIAHSRVARSLSKVLVLGGAQPIFIGPSELLPSSPGALGAEHSLDLDEVIGDLDVIYLLRIQAERMKTLPISMASYVNRYQLDSVRLSKLKGEALVMHPGPMNRGTEIAGVVANSTQVSAIGEQVSSGVCVRMAVLHALSQEIEGQSALQ